MPFKKGQSGNPAGRKPGPLRRRLSILGSQLEELGYNPLTELVALAKSESQSDDMRLKVAQTVMRYAFAPPNTAEISGLGTGTYTSQANKLLAQVAAGDLTLPQAESLLNILLGAGQTALLDEFKRRVETLKAEAKPCEK